MKNLILKCRCGNNIEIPKTQQELTCNACETDLRMPNSYSIKIDNLWNKPGLFKVAALCTAATAIYKTGNF